MGRRTGWGGPDSGVSLSIDAQLRRFLFARPGFANHNGECVKPVIMHQGNGPSVSRQAISKHAGKGGMIQVRASPVWVARQAQHIEGKAAPSRLLENIEGLVKVTDPQIVGNAAFDVENSARDREVGDFHGHGANPPFAVVTLTMNLSRLLDHVLRDVIPNEAASMAGGAKKAQKVAETTAEIDDRGVGAAFEETEKLPVTQFVRSGPVPVDALRRCAVRHEF